MGRAKLVVELAPGEERRHWRTRRPGSLLSTQRDTVCETMSCQGPGGVASVGLFKGSGVGKPLRHTCCGCLITELRAAVPARLLR